VAALEGVTGERVLVIVGPGGRIDVIPVRENPCGRTPTHGMDPRT
jgi:hypothetical protein